MENVIKINQVIERTKMNTFVINFCKGFSYAFTATALWQLVGGATPIAGVVGVIVSVLLINLERLENEQKS
jgi:hypothetical protein